LFPQLFISFVALPGLEMGEATADGRRFLDNQSLNGPIPLMVEEAIAAVERNMRRSGRADVLAFTCGSGLSTSCVIVVSRLHRSSPVVLFVGLRCGSAATLWARRRRR